MGKHCQFRSDCHDLVGLTPCPAVTSLKWPTSLAIALLLSKWLVCKARARDDKVMALDFYTLHATEVHIVL